MYFTGSFIHALVGLVNFDPPLVLKGNVLNHSGHGEKFRISQGPAKMSET